MNYDNEWQVILKSTSQKIDIESVKQIDQRLY